MSTKAFVFAHSDPGGDEERLPDLDHIYSLLVLVLCAYTYSFWLLLIHDVESFGPGDTGLRCPLLAGLCFSARCWGGGT